MRKHSFSWVAGTVAAVLGLVVASSAYAATPSFSLSGIGGNSAEIIVNGDPNSSVLFYYPVSGSSNDQTVTLGSTNSSGSFTTTINGSSYDIASGASVYVVVDNQQSGTEAWPTVTPTGSPVLSQSSVTVGLGQSASITAENGASVYMESNSSPNIASIAVNGSEITATGISPGTTIASICLVGTSSNCTTLSVTAQIGAVSSISFSENNFTLSPSASQSVTISGGDGTYSISSNSNTAVISANLSGTSLTVNGITNGTATVNVCDSNNTCGQLNVTVGSSSSGGSVAFGETNPTLSVGQSVTIGLSNGSNYFVSSNANQSVAEASINESELVVYGSSAGSDALTICASSGGCSTLDVTVSGSSGSASSGAVTFGETNPTMNVGQSLNIGLSGAPSYFVSSNSNSGIAQANVNGSTLSLSGEAIGSDSVTICASSGGCSTLDVTVSGGTTTTTGAPTTTVANSALLAEIQSLQNEMSQLLTQIQTIETNLSQVESQVSTGSGSGISTTVTAPTSANSYNFTDLLTLGSENAQVTALQERLTTLGFYSGPVTGYYGTETQAAVEKYQTARGLTATGYVGPGTRADLNAGE